jgi:hypothetical protein
MAITLSDIRDLPDAKRRKLHLIYKPRGKYRKEIRPKRSREELLAWLKDHDVRTRIQLEKKRVDGDPTLSDYLLEFKKWSIAVGLAFGCRDVELNFKDPEYVAKVVIEFKLWTLIAYEEARKKRPDIIPSVYYVMKKFGGYKNLVVFCKRFSLVEVFNSYMTLRRRLGRVPTLKECTQSNIHLDEAIRFYGSKRKLDNFIASLETIR